MSRPAGRRGPYAKTAGRRADLARAALDVVKEHGHDALTTGEVARRAMVSERTLFYHFPTRDHLLVAALELSDAEQAAAVARLLPAGGGEPGPDDVIRVLSQCNADQPWRLRLAAALGAHAPDPDHPAHAYVARHHAHAIERFADLTRSMQRRGEAHPDLDPVRVARRLVAVWDGLQQQWLVAPDFDLAAEVQEAFRELTGHHVMQVRHAIDQVMALPAVEPRPA